MDTPASLHAEQSLIGAVLLDSKAFGTVKHIAAEDFDLDAHRRIWRAMKRLHADGTTIDIITLDDALAVSAEIELVGGLAYLASIANSTPSSAAIKSYADIVKSHAGRRSVARKAEAVLSAAAAGNDIDAAIRELTASREQMLAGIGLSMPAHMPLGEILRSPKPEFDFVLPSLPTGMVGALAGHGSVGKGYCALSIAIDVALGEGRMTMMPIQKFGKVAFVSIEDDFVALNGRQKSILDTMPGEEGEELVREIEDRLRVVSVYGRPEFRLITRQDGKPVRNEAAIGAFKRAYQGYRLIFVDTLRKFFAGMDENKSDEASEALSILEEIARDTGAAIIYVHHLTKPANTASPDAVPTIFDIRGSGALVADARWAAIYAKPNAAYMQKCGLSCLDYMPEDMRVLNVEKHNHGGGYQGWFARKAGGVFAGFDPAKRIEAAMQIAAPAIQRAGGKKDVFV